MVHLAERDEKSFESWLQIVTTAAIGTEVNVQVGTFTLQSNQTELLDEKFTESPEFKIAVGSTSANSLQCAKLLKTDHCEHVRLMNRHELFYWEQDMRRPVAAFKRPSLGLPDWVSSGLQKLPKELDSCTVWFDEIGDHRTRGQFVHEYHLFEVFIFKTFQGPHLNLFKVFSYGRRFFRSLVFTSSSLFCFHDLTPSLIVNADNAYAICCGKSNIGRISPPDACYGSGLIVKRNLSKDLGPQEFVPRKFLEGIIPSGLLGENCFLESVCREYHSLSQKCFVRR